MSDGHPHFLTEPIRAEDARTRFRCGKHALDDFFARHALANDRAGIGKTFVLRGLEQGSPPVLGFYTLSMGLGPMAEGGGTRCHPAPPFPGAWSNGMLERMASPRSGDHPAPTHITAATSGGASGSARAGSRQALTCSRRLVRPRVKSSSAASSAWPSEAW